MESLKNLMPFQQEKFEPIKNVDSSFKEVLGIDEFKEQLEEVVSFLKHPEEYQKAGATIPAGILLVGEPGTGKTLMARALAGEAGCSFFHTSGSNFDEMIVGVGAKRVKSLFKAARKHAPSIIFIDEIDSLIGKRSPWDSSWNRDCINTLLSEMDGFKKNQNVIVVGATNFEESLDPAATRSGRFDKKIRVSLPNLKGRKEILDFFSSKSKVSGSVDLQEQARRTIGFTGAALKNFVNTALIHAVKQGRASALKEDFDFSFDRIQMGIQRKLKREDKKEEIRATAIHEIGHALIALLTPGAMPVYKVTILPSGAALGHVN